MNIASPQLWKGARAVIGTWYVIQTKPQCEAMAIRDLGERGFCCYAPILKKQVIHSRSKKLVTRRFPLFAGYVFVWKLPHQTFADIREAKGVRGYLVDGDRNPLSVPCADMRRLTKADMDGEFDHSLAGQPSRSKREAIMRKRFPKGSTVRIVRGPFASFSAMVETATAAGVVKALVSILGQAARVNFAAEDLEGGDG